MATLQTLRPLTIRQILNATQAHAEADFVVDGVGIGQVSNVNVVLFVCYLAQQTLS